GAVLATVLLAWLAVPARSSLDEELWPLSAQTHNELVLERYTYEHLEKPIVLVGSSILTMMPPARCRPDEVATLDLAGGSILASLEAIRRLGARPRVLLVEVRTLLRTADRDLLHTVLMAVYWHGPARVPPPHYNRNWPRLI